MHDDSTARRDAIAKVLEYHLLRGEPGACTCGEWREADSSPMTPRTQHSVHQADALLATGVVIDVGALAEEFRRLADPSRGGVWRDACDLLDRVIARRTDDGAQRPRRPRPVNR